MSDMSVSTICASRAEMANAARTTMVTIDVVTGWCQNSHSIVAADSIKTATNPKALVRLFDELLMPAPGV